ncbi:MAG: DUF6787 family protein [Melioribacteraceae bacterium]
MENIWQKLKSRWEVESNFQAATILFTFAITGVSTIFLRTYIYTQFNFDPSINFGYRIASLLLITLPLYNIILFSWGTILGQKIFFKSFILGQIKKIVYLFDRYVKKY